MKEEQDKRKLLKELDGLKTKALQRGGKIPPPEGKNEAFLNAEVDRIMKEAKDDKVKRRAINRKNTESWARDEAKFISKKMRNSVSVIGGFGSPRPNICDICKKTVGHIISVYSDKEKKWIHKCDECRKAGIEPKKTYLKIVIH